MAAGLTRAWTGREAGRVPFVYSDDGLEDVEGGLWAGIVVQVNQRPEMFEDGLGGWRGA